MNVKKGFLEDNRGQAIIPISAVILLGLFLVAIIVGGFGVIAQLAIYTLTGLISGIIITVLFNFFRGQKKQYVGRMKFGRRKGR